jgi:hypothetical protein
MKTPVIHNKKEITDLGFNTLHERLSNALIGEFVDEESRQVARDIIRETLDYEGLDLKADVDITLDGTNFIFIWTMNDKDHPDMVKLKDRINEINESK